MTNATAEQPYIDPRTNHTAEFFKHLIDMRLKRPGEILGIEASYVTFDKATEVVVSAEPTKTIGIYAFSPEQLTVHLLDWSEEESYLLYCVLDKLADDLGIEKSGTFYR